MGTRARRFFLLSLILLVAFALRVHGLSALLDSIHYDEAYYANDALSLIATPRLQPFFDGNYGREGLWMVLLTPALSSLGGGALAIRITAIFTGLLTVAAVYRLARALGWGTTAAISSMAVLATLYWHVQLSHLGMRALTMPLIGALALAALWFAYKTDKVAAWGIVGMWIGLLAYTYIAARAWIALAALLWVGMMIERWRRGGGVLRPLFGLGAALIIAAPLVAYIITNPAAANQRIDQVGITEGSQVIANIGAWLPVPFTQGPTDIVYNLPGRPLFDLPLTLLIGLGGTALLANRLLSLSLTSLIFICALLATALAPALVTSEPLRWLRAIGIVIPIALLIGAGAGALDHTLRRFHQAAGVILIGALLAWAAVSTTRDLDTWTQDAGLYQPMERGLMRGIDTLAANTPPDTPIYLAPFSLDHPVIRLRQHVLSEYLLNAFIPVECILLTPGRPALYFGLTAFTPGLRVRLEQFAPVEVMIAADRDEAGIPRWQVFRATPPADLFGGAAGTWSRFADELEARAFPLPAQTARAGETIPLTVAFRSVSALNRPTIFFAHLLDSSGGLVGQAYTPLCRSAPSSRWRTDEVMIQSFGLTVPPNLARGAYRLVYGIYESPAGARLPLQAGGNTVPLETMQVTPR